MATDLTFRSFFVFIFELNPNFFNILFPFFFVFQCYGVLFFRFE